MSAPKTTTGEDRGARRPAPTALLRAFLIVGCLGFGTAVPWVRRMAVQLGCWMRPEEFSDRLALAQFLPGPNSVNLAVAIGESLGGLVGAVMALGGLLLVPVLAQTVLAALYVSFGDLGIVHRVFGGVVSAAAGLALALAVQVARPLLRHRPSTSLPVMAIGFATVGVLGWPLPWVMFGLVPLSIALARKRPT